MAGLKNSSSVADNAVEQKSRVVRPLFSSGVSAGFPSPAEDYIERSLDLNELLIENPAATFFVRVNGDSMTGAGINHNDILVVDRSLEPVSGKIVIAIVAGEFTVKRLVRDGEHCQLVAENPDYPPLEVTPESSCEIWGVVSGAIKQF
ncbi:MAG: translesion error-prone DNA polymerase V autoproteolytic subunit [Thermodesulfobacteriota bacterium]